MKISLFTKLSIVYITIFLLFLGVGIYSVYVYHLTAKEFKSVNRFHLKLTIYAYELESRQSMLLLVLKNSIENKGNALNRRWLNITLARRNAGIKRIENFVQSLPENWRDSYFNVRILPVIERIRAVYNKITYPHLGVRIKTEKLKNLSIKEKKMMTLIHKLALASRSRLRRVASKLEDKEERQLRIHLSLIILVLVGGIIGAWITRKSLLPLRTLIDGARFFGEGILETRIPIETRDEIGELAKEFNFMAQALKEREEKLLKSERLAAAGKLASGIAHEIRNPLAAISFQVELLQELLETQDKNDIKQSIEILARLQSEIDRLEQTTSQYLEFSRQPSPNIKSYDIKSLFEELSLSLQGLNLKLDLLIDKNINILVDDDMFYRISLNLLKNSKEANADTITIKVLTPNNQKGMVIISYTDNGDGIPNNIGDKIFEPFFSTKQKGTGLGLALVKRMMLDMNGNIELTSNNPIEFKLYFKMDKNDC